MADHDCIETLKRKLSCQIKERLEKEAFIGEMEGKAETMHSSKVEMVRSINRRNNFLQKFNSLQANEDEMMQGGFH